MLTSILVCGKILFNIDLIDRYSNAFFSWCKYFLSKTECADQLGRKQMIHIYLAH